MNLFERITSLFAPNECLSCRREGRLLCRHCVALLAPPAKVCFSCKKVASGVGCQRCLQESGCASITAATSYQGLAKQLVVSLKFTGNQSAAQIMAQHMAAVYTQPDGILVTYMPATTAHVRQRGYDQAALLAKHLARMGGTQCSALLARLGNMHQLGADRNTRLQQLQDSLRILRADKVMGRSVLLVDDVLTTGASIRAATTALLKAGAQSVHVLVFAQAPPEQIKKTSRD